MSTGKRAYDLLRGYVNREWDRIQGVDRDAAERELFDAASVGPSVPATPVEPDREGFEMVARANDRARAASILGVSLTDGFEVVHKAYDRLNKRSDPGNFPAGSAEAAHALEIRQRVQWAFRLLTDGMDQTERRFRSLEID
ncbi:MAG: hypothetical protein SFX74_03375 [Fimbriimonadaceae bacterium]|nr:hypothetical protein [Fimbriimonadaceae bacterium]